MILVAVKNNLNLNLSSLVDFHKAIDKSDKNSYSELYITRFNIFKQAVLDKIDSNKKNYDFNKDGKFNLNDIMPFINAISSPNGGGGATDINGLDLDNDGKITNEEKEALWGYNENDESLIYNIVNSFVDGAPNDKKVLSEWISTLENVAGTLPDNYSKSILFDIISGLDDKMYDCWKPYDTSYWYE